MAQSNTHPTQVSYQECIILLSGGIDSAACVDFYLRQHFAVRGLHVSYGQPGAQQEVASARAIARHYGIPIKLVQVAGTRAKTDGEVLGRNAFLLFMALLEVDVQSAIVAIGIHSGTPYYDCSSGFLSTVQAIFDGQCDGRFRVAAPFLEWTKGEVWEYCVAHQVPVNLTYSCERGLKQPCGVCSSCRDLEVLHA